MTPHNRRGGCGLPPQYPARRGSNTPISPLAAKSSPTPPNRSRSLDGLLDAEPASAVAKNSTLIEQIPSNATQSCDELDVEKSNVNSGGEMVDSDVDKVSVKSNSSEKRKRNFMDRCVNKVRSFIRK